MKFGLIAACALLGIAALGGAASAQDNTTATLSRVPQTEPFGSLSRMAAPGPAPELEAARPPAGMLPAQPTEPSRNASRSDAAAATSSSLRSSLRP